MHLEKNMIGKKQFATVLGFLMITTVLCTAAFGQYDPPAKVIWKQQIGNGAGNFWGGINPFDRFGKSAAPLGDLNGEMGKNAFNFPICFDGHIGEGYSIEPYQKCKGHTYYILSCL